MTSDDDDDDNPFDARGILKDGRSLRVSMQMRDSAPQSPRVAEDQFQLLADAERRRRQLGAEARAAYDEEASNAWRNPTRIYEKPAGADPLSAGQGNPCTISGAPGRLVRQGDWLVCMPTTSTRGTNNAPTSLADAIARRTAMRRQLVAEYDAAAAEAWRNPT